MARNEKVRNAILPILDLMQEIPAVCYLIPGIILFGLGAIPAGIIEKYIGARTLLIIYQLGSATGGIIIITANTPLQITIGLGILGLSSSIYHPAGLTILSRNLDSLSRGLGLHGIAGSLGLALGPLFAGITAELGSWRLSYLICLLYTSDAADEGLGLDIGGRRIII